MRQIKQVCRSPLKVALITSSLILGTTIFATTAGAGGKTPVLLSESAPIAVSAVNQNGVVSNSVMSYRILTYSGPVNQNTGIQPDTATGTNQDVTIYIQGSGLNVTGWETSAEQFSGCDAPTSYFWAKHPNGNSYYLVDYWWYSGPCLTVPSGYQTIQWWADTTAALGQYVNGTSLCNSWEPFPGYPCETIHS